MGKSGSIYTPFLGGRSSNNYFDRPATKAYVDQFAAGSPVGFGLAAGDGISISGNEISLDRNLTTAGVQGIVGPGATTDSFFTVTNSANTGATYTCVTDALEDSLRNR